MVGVDNGEAADAGGGEVEQCRAAQAAGADDEHGGGAEFCLGGGAKAGEAEVASVALGFGGGKGHGAGV